MQTYRKYSCTIFAFVMVSALAQPKAELENKGAFEASNSASSAPKPKIAVACPGYAQRLRSILESEYKRIGIGGVVQAKLIINANGVQDVEIISGPAEYHPSVRSALLSIDCKLVGADRVIVPLDLKFGSRP